MLGKRARGCVVYINRSTGVIDTFIAREAPPFRLLYGRTMTTHIRGKLEQAILVETLTRLRRRLRGRE